jgi:hypothetical protein
MIHGEDCYAAGELEALLLRHRAPSDHDDAAAWEDLGTLVCRLLSTCHRRSPVAAPGGPFRPARIFHYWDQPSPPDDVAACMASWGAAGIPVEAWHREQADAFLDEQFGGDVLAAFRHAHHPAMQADLFRLASLYLHGGLYVDADDAFVADAAPIAFPSSAALLPLAVSRATDASLTPKVDDPAADQAWYYFGNAPLFGLPGHPLFERALDRAVAAVTACRRRGELCQIHRDTGPGSFSMAALDHAVSCFRNGLPITLSVTLDWPFLEQSRDLAYKQTGRNWRTNAVLYAPAAVAPVAAPAAGAPARGTR